MRGLTARDYEIMQMAARHRCGHQGGMRRALAGDDMSRWERLVSEGRLGRCGCESAVVRPIVTPTGREAMRIHELMLAALPR